MVSGVSAWNNVMLDLYLVYGVVLKRVMVFNLFSGVLYFVLNS